eukprot:scpid91907/ scgid22944/ 
MAEHVSVSEYSRRILRVTIAKLCEDIGWQAIESTALSVLVEVLEKYILSLGRRGHLWQEHAICSHGDFVNLASELLYTNANSLNEIILFASSRDCPKLPFLTKCFEENYEHQSVRLGKDHLKALFGNLDSDTEEEQEENDVIQPENPDVQQQEEEVEEREKGGGESSRHSARDGGEEVVEEEKGEEEEEEEEEEERWDLRLELSQS